MEGRIKGQEGVSKMKIRPMDVIYFNQIILFLIAFLLMTFSDGSVTIKFMNQNNVVNPALDFNYSLPGVSNNNNLDSLYKYKYSLQGQQEKIPFINNLLFFLILPFINISYGIYCFCKGQLIWTGRYKHLNNPTS